MTEVTATSDPERPINPLDETSYAGKLVAMASAERPAAEVLRPVVRGIIGKGEPPFTIRCWDGSTIGPDTAPVTIVIRSPRALRRLLYQPNEIGLGRAYVAGELDVDGDVYAALDVRALLAGRDEGLHLGLRPRGWFSALRAAYRLGMLGPPIPPPAEEVRLGGRIHSRRRDAAAIAHHYDVGNEFYRLVLGPSMTYSCAYWNDDGLTLEEAQSAKHELVSRKLALESGMRLLDIGCGWGGMVLHAAEHFGVSAVGVTVSQEQASRARERVKEAGLDDRVEIRLQDYRDVDDGPFDAVSSIGMFEHVGLNRLAEYFSTMYGLLRPHGRFLNHAISRPAGDPPVHSKSFIGRYVFPDGELQEVGAVVTAMQEEGFEVRDLESLREHYGLTLRRWVANLEARWEEAQRLVGPSRARIWRLYMAGSAVNFEEARTSVHQVLGVKVDDQGRSGVPLTRSWLAERHMVGRQ